MGLQQIFPTASQWQGSTELGTDFFGQSHQEGLSCEKRRLWWIGSEVIYSNSNDK